MSPRGRRVFVRCDGATGPGGATEPRRSCGDGGGNSGAGVGGSGSVLVMTPACVGPIPVSSAERGTAASPDWRTWMASTAVQLHGSSWRIDSTDEVGRAPAE
jgi:hypothetical protein